jgi:hypothetical protein
VIACIDTPVSWPRLERFALAGADATIAAHVAACPACARCLDEIRADVVALPPIVVPVVAKRRWWVLAIPALAAAAVIFAVWPRPRPREDIARVKGVGEVILGTVRERDGAITEDAATYLPGDRFKVVVTCPPAASAWIVVEVGGDRPLPPAQLACGNRVVVPGAFHLDGDVNRVCVEVAAAADQPAARACVTVRPE